MMFNFSEKCPVQIKKNFGECYIKKKLLLFIIKKSTERVAIKLKHIIDTGKLIHNIH